MANLSLLFDIILKIFVTGLPIVALILLYVNRKDKLWTYRYLVLFLLTLCGATYFHIRVNQVKSEKAKKYFGLYKLERLDCEDCETCEIDLRSDYKYNIIKDGQIVGVGIWSLGLYDMGYYLDIENGPNYVIDESLRRIESISRINCCLKGCKNNLKAEFQAKVIDIRVKGYHFNQKTLFLLGNSRDTLEYFPDYYMHPWIEDKINVGDILIKRRNSMDFTVIKTKGDTSFFKFEAPICETICK